MTLDHHSVLITIPEPYDRNPWVGRDCDREFAINDDDPQVWLPQIIAGYQGHEEPVGTCSQCYGCLWFDDRTGGHKCFSCRAYANPQGVIIGVPKQKEDAHV